MKLSDNDKLINGFTKQLPAYNSAEETVYSIYLVIQIKNNPRILKNLEQRAAEANRPKLVIVDARQKLSASLL